MILHKNDVLLVKKAIQLSGFYKKKHLNNMTMIYAYGYENKVAFILSDGDVYIRIIGNHVDENYRGEFGWFKIIDILNFKSKDDVPECFNRNNAVGNTNVFIEAPQDDIRFQFNNPQYFLEQVNLHSKFISLEKERDTLRYVALRNNVFTRQTYFNATDGRKVSRTIVGKEYVSSYPMIHYDLQEAKRADENDVLIDGRFATLYQHLFKKSEFILLSKESHSSDRFDYDYKISDTLGNMVAYRFHYCYPEVEKASPLEPEFTRVFEVSSFLKQLKEVKANIKEINNAVFLLQINKEMHLGWKERTEDGFYLTMKTIPVTEYGSMHYNKGNIPDYSLCDINAVTMMLNDNMGIEDEDFYVALNIDNLITIIESYQYLDCVWIRFNAIGMIKKKLQAYPVEFAPRLHDRNFDYRLLMPLRS